MSHKPIDPIELRDIWSVIKYLMRKRNIQGRMTHSDTNVNVNLGEELYLIGSEKELCEFEKKLEKIAEIRSYETALIDQVRARLHESLGENWEEYITARMVPDRGVRVTPRRIKSLLEIRTPKELYQLDRMIESVKSLIKPKSPGGAGSKDGSKDGPKETPKVVPREPKKNELRGSCIAEPDPEEAEEELGYDE